MCVTELTVSHMSNECLHRGLLMLNSSHTFCTHINSHPWKYKFLKNLPTPKCSIENKYGHKDAVFWNTVSNWLGTWFLIRFDVLFLFSFSSFCSTTALFRFLKRRPITGRQSQRQGLNATWNFCVGLVQSVAFKMISVRGYGFRSSFT